MFSSELAESKVLQICIKDTAYNEFELLLEFVYMGGLRVSCNVHHQHITGAELNCLLKPYLIQLNPSISGLDGFNSGCLSAVHAEESDAAALS